MSEPQWKHLAPYLVPYFDYAVREHGTVKRFWVAENGFPNGTSFDTKEEAVADVSARRRSGLQYQIYDGKLHEWVFVTSNHS
jgi:hypothetical protein